MKEKPLSQKSILELEKILPYKRGCEWAVDTTLNELPLSYPQKIITLEWFAKKLWYIGELASDDTEFYGKSYDPLFIEGDIAHSYVFDLQDGGRHHEFESLEQIETDMIQEVIGWILQAHRRDDE